MHPRSVTVIAKPWAILWATWATDTLQRAEKGPLTWSGRRDSNPRPSPWQKKVTGTVRPVVPGALTCAPVRDSVRAVRPVRAVRSARYQRARGPIQRVRPGGYDEALPIRRASRLAADAGNSPRRRAACRGDDDRTLKDGPVLGSVGVVHAVTPASNTAGTPNAIGGQSCPHVVEYHPAEVMQRSAGSMAPNPMRRFMERGQSRTAAGIALTRTEVSKANATLVPAQLPRSARSQDEHPPGADTCAEVVAPSREGV
jgi:hypothetical protein